jgi:hypothetical protein
MMYKVYALGGQFNEKNSHYGDYDFRRLSRM